MGGGRALVLVCLTILSVACEQASAPPPVLVVPTTSSTVYVTNNNTVNVVAPTATPTPTPPPPPPPIVEPPPPPPPLPTPVTPKHAVVTPSQRASVGVIECDQYIARLERCTAAYANDKFETMLDTMWENYKFAARTSEGRQSLAIGCRGGLKMIDCQ
jgi:hypothetical protein